MAKRVFNYLALLIKLTEPLPDVHHFDASHSMFQLARIFWLQTKILHDSLAMKSEKLFDAQTVSKWSL